jgi:hypothetical protein
VWYGWPLLVVCLCLSGWLHLRLTASERCATASAAGHHASFHLSSGQARAPAHVAGGATPEGEWLTRAATEAPFVSCPPDAGTLDAEERQCVLALQQQRAAQQELADAQEREASRLQRSASTVAAARRAQRSRVRAGRTRRAERESGSDTMPESARESDTQILVWHGANVLDGLWRWGDASGRVHPLPNHLGTPIQQPECPVRCAWTWDRNALSSADVVLFDPCHYGTKEFERYAPELPEKRAHQSWWYYSYEQPHYFTLQQKREYMRHFEANITYDRSGKCPVSAFESATEEARIASQPRFDFVRCVSSSFFSPFHLSLSLSLSLVYPL